MKFTRFIVYIKRAFPKVQSLPPILVTTINELAYWD